MKINIQNNDFELTLYLNKKTTKKIAYVLLGAFGHKILDFILELLNKC